MFIIRFWETAHIPSLKPTFCPKWEVSIYVGLGVCGQFPRNVFDPMMVHFYYFFGKRWRVQCSSSCTSIRYHIYRQKMRTSTNKNNSEGYRWFDRGDIRELKDNKYQILDSLKSNLFSSTSKQKRKDIKLLLLEISAYQLRGGPCKNWPLEFQQKTEFLHFFLRQN